MNVSQRETTVMTDEASRTSFPTMGLKSLLQNSDLLEILLKPLSNTKSDDVASFSTPGIDSFSSEAVSNASPTSEIGTELLAGTQLDALTDLTGLIDVPKTKTLLDWENSDEYLESTHLFKDRFRNFIQFKQKSDSKGLNQTSYLSESE